MSDTTVQRVVPTAFDSTVSGGQIELRLYTTQTGDDGWTVEQVTHVVELTPAAAVDLVHELRLVLSLTEDAA